MVSLPAVGENHHIHQMGLGIIVSEPILRHALRVIVAGLRTLLGRTVVSLGMARLRLTRFRARSARRASPRHHEAVLQARAPQEDNHWRFSQGFVPPRVCIPPKVTGPHRAKVIHPQSPAGMHRFHPLWRWSDQHLLSGRRRIIWNSALLE